jgi:hypothetical protein
MNIFTLKNIMKEVNAPNTFQGVPSDKPNGDRYEFNHPLYWVFKVENMRIKTLDSRLKDKRKPHARFDVFMYLLTDDSQGELFVRPQDYVYEQVSNDFYVKMKRTNFPVIDRNGDPWSFSTNDRIFIKGDIENVN